MKDKIYGYIDVTKGFWKCSNPTIIAIFQRSYQYAAPPFLRGSSLIPRNFLGHFFRYVHFTGELNERLHRISGSGQAAYVSAMHRF